MPDGALGKVRGAVIATAVLTAACGAILGIGDRLPEDVIVTPDGAVDEGPIAPDAPDDPVLDRTLTITVDWPTLGALDPLKDGRATKVNVDVADATDPTRAAAPLVVDSTNPGPYTVTLKSTRHVDAVVQVVTAGGQILGYGRRLAWDVEKQPDVPVAVRRRLLYFASSDRGIMPGQLRALGMAPPGVPEPAVDETLPALATLKEPTDLFISTDGVTIVESGTAGSGKGALAVFATGSHAKLREVELTFKPVGVARIGEGDRALAAPRHASGDPAVDVFAVVDVQSGQVTPVPGGGPPGGAIDVMSVAASPDGKHVAAVGAVAASGGGTTPALFLFDDATSKMTFVDLGSLTPRFANAQGVRFARDSKSVVVAGSNDADGGWFTGKLVRFALDGTVAEHILSMAADETKPAGLLLHTDGTSAFVSNEMRSGIPNCCADTWLFDLVAKTSKKIGPFNGTAPDYQFTAGFKVPYAPGYVWLGQSDFGNNLNGPIIDVTTPNAPKAVPRESSVGDIGTMDGVATPFGEPL